MKMKEYREGSGGPLASPPPDPSLRTSLLRQPGNRTFFAVNCRWTHKKINKNNEGNQWNYFGYKKCDCPKKRPYVSTVGPACIALNPTGSPRSVGAIGVRIYCTDPTLDPTNGIIFCRQTFYLLSVYPLVPLWCFTYLKLGFLGAPGEVPELELDGSGLGRADLDERPAAGLQVDPRARDLRGSAETRVQVLPQIKLKQTKNFFKIFFYFLKKNFEDISRGYYYPCFRLVVTPALSLKVRVSSLICTW